MRFLVNIIVVTAILIRNGALAFDEIVGYQPQTDVTDQLMLDLDQYNIEEQLIQRKKNLVWKG
jgi:hypothetical protein